jgi:hypothetical protein
MTAFESAVMSEQRQIERQRILPPGWNDPVSPDDRRTLFWMGLAALVAAAIHAWVNWGP